MLIHEGDVVTLFCDECHKETRIFIGPEEKRDYYYCGHCGVFIKDEQAIDKKVKEYLRLASVVDTGEENYTWS